MRQGQGQGGPNPRPPYSAVALSEAAQKAQAQDSSAQKVKPYIFDPMCILDIEMTETDPAVGKIAEIAVYLVSGDMRQQILIANMIIKLELGDIKNDEVIKRFSKSGLWLDLQNPEKVVPLNQAEELIIKQMEEYGITSGQIPSAGIQAYNDRIILQREMPSFNKFLNFTIIDISSVDEIASRWNKRVFNKRDSKESRLRAEPNARRAIQRLQYYKMQLFKNQGPAYERPQYQGWWPSTAHTHTYQDGQSWDSSQGNSSTGQTQGNQQHDSGAQGNKNMPPAFYPGQNFWKDRD